MPIYLSQRNASTGYSGYSGFSGIKGIQGVTGIQGATGATGAQGTTGTSGFSGFSGIKGIQGVNGTQGVTGTQGTIGTTGAQGTYGNTGLQGTTGTTSYTATSVVTSVGGANSVELVRGNMADSDYFRILVGGTTSNAGFAEFATADDGNEPIYVRQYIGTFASVVRSATLLDESGNTSFPGTLTAAQVYNAVYNDIADYLELEKEIDIEYGKCYIRKNNEVRLSNEYCEQGIIGITSDTLGFGVGKKDIGKKEIPIAVAGFVLAYCEDIYESGTPLTSSENGYLKEADRQTAAMYPERIVGTFYKEEEKELWNDIVVNGRHWVKIK